MDAAVDVCLEPLGSPARLEGLWRALQSRAQGTSFFLSWHWIGPWIDSLPAAHRPAHLMVARQAGRCVGLALLGDQPLRAAGLNVGRALHLNETGLTQYDIITIEHNGFLVDAQCTQVIHQAMAAFLDELALRYSRVFARALDGAAGVGAGRPARSLRVHDQVLACWTTDLQALRDTGNDMPPGLSAKRRAHLRRGLRAYAELGALELAQAATADEALAWLEHLLVWHGSRRHALDKVSDFDTPFSRQFHKRLIQTQFETGAVQMLRITVGGQELGYLYNFVFRGRVNFYQSGFNYDLLDGKQSPGMVCLVLALRHSAASGHAVFDYLAGESQYKVALGTHREELHSVMVERSGVLALAARGLRWYRECRRRLLKRFAPSLYLLSHWAVEAEFLVPLGL